MSVVTGPMTDSDEAEGFDLALLDETMRSHAPELDRFLRDRRVTYVRAEYSGSQGVGGFDAIQYSRDDGSPCLIADGVFNSRLKTIFRSLLASRYPTWNLGDGSSGDFRWELTANLLTHSHYQRGSSQERSVLHNI